MNKLSLCGKWLGRCIISSQESFEYIASVPGCAINDLVEAGKLPQDLFWRNTADQVADYESCDYIYQTSFSFNGVAKYAKLLFDRIDTYADVFLNGKLIYHCENGNISHEIPVSDIVKAGNNSLEVRLYSPVEQAKSHKPRQGAFTTERLNTRRMQCTYGWDWVGRFVTCGLGDCYLVSYDEDEAIINDVYITTQDVDNESATMRVDVQFANDYTGRILDFNILSPDGKTVCNIKRYCAEPFVRTDFDIPNPLLWYPLGYGEQPLYTFELRDGERLVHSEAFGIRTVKIMQLPDEIGSANYETCLSIKNPNYDFNDGFSGFVLKVNGVKIFCKGANWVPCEPYAVEGIEEKQTALLELCAQAGVNMLRVWGGGCFETKHFYDECSRLGITVTQDFLMACGNYPEDEEWFINELQKEALYAALLLRNQPCLMWWSGDNENAVLGCDTDEDYKGRRSAYKGIAPVLYKLDPYRRFLPSSPYGGNMYSSNTIGTTHNTHYLSYTLQYFLKDDLSDYKDELKKYRARFIAEEPQLGAVSTVSLKRFMTDDDIYNESDMWLYHTKSNPDFDRELFDYIVLFAEKTLGQFQDGKDRVFKLRYIQYEWLRVVMEQARREKDFCSGIIFWMMNDCWPAAAGWALIDYYGLPKDAYYAFKRCAKPVIVSIDRTGETYSVYLSNDSLSDYAVRGTASLVSADKKTIRQTWELDGISEANKAAKLAEIATTLQEGECLVCDIEGEFGNDRTFYKNGGLEIVPADVTLTVDCDNSTITVTADSYVHAITINGNAVFEDNCFSILPGETKTLHYELLSNADASEFYVEAYTLA